MVLPADAGMSLGISSIWRVNKGAPRRRGDEPKGQPLAEATKQCSPQTRG